MMDRTLNSVRRRVGALETVITADTDSPSDYPALTPGEIEALTRRLQAGESLEADALARLEPHCPIATDKEIFYIHRGQLIVVRYRAGQLPRFDSI